MRVFFLASMLFFSVISPAATLNKIVVFGDSLSDNGNLYEYMKHQFPLSPPYYEGRMTNGPVWAELFAKAYFPTDLKAHFSDYAYAGAGVEDGEDDEPLFTLHSEIDSYLLTHQDKADENALYVLWIGSNNYLAVPENINQSVKNVMNGMQRGLRRLADKGAKHIVVLNLPDLGRIPVARDFDAVSQLTELSTKHNAQLLERLDALKQRYPSVQWLHFDVRGELDDILTHPERHGFSNVMGTCYEAAIDEPSDQSALQIVAHVQAHLTSSVCDGYLFFDPVHPSAAAHQLLARRMGELLQEAGISFSQ